MCSFWVDGTPLDRRRLHPLRLGTECGDRTGRPSDLSDLPGGPGRKDHHHHGEFEWRGLWLQCELLPGEHACQLTGAVS